MNLDAKLNEFWEENTRFPVLYNTVLFEGKNESAETVIQNIRKEGSTDAEIARVLGWSAARVRNLKRSTGH